MTATANSAKMRWSAVVVLAAASGFVATPAVARPDISGTGIGTLKLGMSPEAAAARGWIKRTSSPCNSGWRVARYRQQLSVSVWQGKVMAMSTSSRRFATSRGVRPGDSIRVLKARYPVTRLGTNLYTSGAVLGVPGTDLYFTVRGGRVSSIELANGFVPDGSELEC